MNVEIGADAALFPEKEYINGIAVAVHNISNRIAIRWLGRQTSEIQTSRPILPAKIPVQGDNCYSLPFQVDRSFIVAGK